MACKEGILGYQIERRIDKRRLLRRIINPPLLPCVHHWRSIGFTITEANNKEAGDGLQGWNIVHTKRECNSAAREPAQLAIRTKHSIVWRFNWPVCIEQIIAHECNLHCLLSNE